MAIAGEAGIGKSRLVVSVQAHAQERGFLCLQGQCFEQDRAVPYAPLLDLLQAGNPQISQHARDTRVKFDPLTGYGHDGARGTIVDIRGDDYRVRLDSGKVVEAARRP